MEKVLCGGSSVGGQYSERNRRRHRPGAVGRAIKGDREPATPLFPDHDAHGVDGNVSFSVTFSIDN
jgi:hypothetical protein